MEPLLIFNVLSARHIHTHYSRTNTNIQYNNYNNDYLFAILNCLQLSCIQHLSVILLTTTRYSAYNLFVSTNTYSLDLCSEEFQTTTVLFPSNVTLHKTDWITTTAVYSIKKVLIVEYSCFRLLENSISASFLFVYNVHYRCVRYVDLFLYISFILILILLLVCL